MNPQPSIQMPGQWSTVAPTVDWMFYFIYWLSVVMFVGIVATAMYFVVKYRRRPGVKAEPTGHNNTLEIGWTVAPVVFLVFLFHFGFKGWMELRVPPGDALVIRVRAKKWLWDFEYPNGMHSVTDLHVPVHRAVRVVLSSDDVLHSFFVPAFRIKQDAVPGYYQTAWFEAVHTGRVDLFCAEYCGTGHSAMHGNVIIQTQAAFDRFLAEGAGPRQGETPELWGRRVAQDTQCLTCHTIDGTPSVGPSWRGLWDRTENLADGTTAHVDENYLRESILLPGAKVVRGFAPVMPTFQGTLQDRQIDALIAYIRSLH
ncbi:MAG: cytochrome c oxidase subunit II [Deltaproteobacteria bacterium]